MGIRTQPVRKKVVANLIIISEVELTAELEERKRSRIKVLNDVAEILIRQCR